MVQIYPVSTLKAPVPTPLAYFIKHICDDAVLEVTMLLCLSLQAGLF